MPKSLFNKVARLQPAAMFLKKSLAQGLWSSFYTQDFAKRLGKLWRGTFAKLLREDFSQNTLG